MRGAVALAWALVGCSGDGGSTDGGPTTTHNGMGVRLVVDEVPDTLFELSATVEQVVLEGRGPEGAEALSYDARTRVDVVGGAPGSPIVLDLAVGEWRDVTLTTRLGADDVGPALFAAGRVGTRRFELSVEPSLDLVGRGGFDLGAGLDATADVVLDPEKWLDELDEEELDDEDGVVRLDLAHNTEAYEGLVERILDTTRVRFPGQEEDERDGSR